MAKSSLRFHESRLLTLFAYQNSNLQSLKKYIPGKSKPEDLEAAYQANFNLFQRFGLFNQSQNVAEFSYKTVNQESLDALTAKLKEAFPREVAKELTDSILNLFKQSLLNYAEIKV